jgi:hypothetical protein
VLIYRYVKTLPPKMGGKVFTIRESCTLIGSGALLREWVPGPGRAVAAPQAVGPLVTTADQLVTTPRTDKAPDIGAKRRPDW